VVPSPRTSLPSFFNVIIVTIIIFTIIIVQIVFIVNSIAIVIVITLVISIVDVIIANIVTTTFVITINFDVVTVVIIFQSEPDLCRFLSHDCYVDKWKPHTITDIVHTGDKIVGAFTTEQYSNQNKALATLIARISDDIRDDMRKNDDCI
jgi:hypothetical protein